MCRMGGGGGRRDRRWKTCKMPQQPTVWYILEVRQKVCGSGASCNKIDYIAFYIVCQKAQKTQPAIFIFYFHCFLVPLCKWRPLTLKPLPSEQHSRSDIWPLNSTTDSLVFADQRVASAPSMSRQLVSWAVDHREWSWKEKPGNGDVWPVCVEDPGHLLQGLHLVRGEQVSEGCQQGGVHQIGHCLPLKSKHLSCRCYYIVRTGSTGCSVKVLGQPSLANLVLQWKGSHP